MTLDKLFLKLSLEEDIDALNLALNKFFSENESRISWQPVGDKVNNKGMIEISSDPGRALVERVTNAIDALLELGHDSHKGIPDCKSPREAATAWFNIPKEGLSKLSATERRSLGQRVKVTIQKGAGRQLRIFQVRDYGIGILPE